MASTKKQYHFPPKFPSSTKCKIKDNEKYVERMLTVYKLDLQHWRNECCPEKKGKLYGRLCGYRNAVIALKTLHKELMRNDKNIPYIKEGTIGILFSDGVPTLSMADDPKPIRRKRKSVCTVFDQRRNEEKRRRRIERSKISAPSAESTIITNSSQRPRRKSETVKTDAPVSTAVIDATLDFLCNQRVALGEEQYHNVIQIELSDPTFGPIIRQVKISIREGCLHTFLFKT